MLFCWLRALTIAALWASSTTATADFLPPGELRRLDVKSLGENELDAQLARLVPIFDLSALSPIAQPADAEIALGQRLFHDKRLSGNGQMSCATCHISTRGTGDGLSLARGAHGHQLFRNTPALYNVGRPDYTRFFWDGRLEFNPSQHNIRSPLPELIYGQARGKSLLDALKFPVSAQVLFPMINPSEMLATSDSSPPRSSFEIWGEIERRLGVDIKYGPKMDISRVANALSAYIATQFSVTQTPWDRYLRGDTHALSLRQKRGAFVFATKGRCLKCHNGPHLSNFTLQNAGFDQLGPEDLGAYTQTGLALDKFAFRVPPLRNLRLTAPYGHSGAYSSLREVVEHYRHPKRSASPLIGDGITISDSEARDLVFFLENGLFQAIP